ncbi:MAG: nicotinate-nucleotide adenylyltransferase [Defluviitaleaceae bacterium]|nr:nicotinate-nucleotide adenylyltransferase [Defluviitaleaceae bacterium]
MKKIAIFGGSFDPIHNGHLQVMASIKEDLAIDELIIIPTGENPLKGKRTPKEHRLNMVKLAVNKQNTDKQKYTISDIEIKRAGLSFSHETMKIIKEENEEAELFFTIGADILEDLEAWEGFEKLKELVTFLILNRPGYPLKIPKNIKYRVFKIPFLEISSTYVRELISDEKEFEHLVPREAAAYIKENELYKISFDNSIYEYADAELKKLKEKRYKHIFGVAEEAMALAKHYNINEEKAKIAALFHDIAKEYTREQIDEHIKKYNTQMPPLTITQTPLIHGFIGADLAEEQGIQNKDILDAIRYHTIGRSNMGMLEKIIYIADAFEPNRIFPEREKLKSLAYEDINRAIHTQLMYLLEKKRGMFIHPNCFLLLEDLKENYGIN